MAPAAGPQAHRGVQRLVVVGLGRGDVVLQTHTGAACRREQVCAGTSSCWQVRASSRRVQRVRKNGTAQQVARRDWRCAPHLHAARNGRPEGVHQAHHVIAQLLLRPASSRALQPVFGRIRALKCTRAGGLHQVVVQADMPYTPHLTWGSSTSGSTHIRPGAAASPVVQRDGRAVGAAAAARPRLDDHPQLRYVRHLLRQASNSRHVGSLASFGARCRTPEATGAAPALACTLLRAPDSRSNPMHARQHIERAALTLGCLPASCILRNVLRARGEQRSRAGVGWWDGLADRQQQHATLSTTSISFGLCWAAAAALPQAEPHQRFTPVQRLAAGLHADGAHPAAQVGVALQLLLQQGQGWFIRSSVYVCSLHQSWLQVSRHVAACPSTPLINAGSHLQLPPRRLHHRLLRLPQPLHLALHRIVLARVCVPGQSGCRMGPRLSQDAVHPLGAARRVHQRGTPRMRAQQATTRQTRCIRCAVCRRSSLEGQLLQLLLDGVQAQQARQRRKHLQAGRHWQRQVS